MPTAGDLGMSMALMGMILRAWVSDINGRLVQHLLGLNRVKVSPYHIYVV